MSSMQSEFFVGQRVAYVIDEISVSPYGHTAKRVRLCTIRFIRDDPFGDLCYGVQFNEPPRDMQEEAEMGLSAMWYDHMECGWWCSADRLVQIVDSRAPDWNLKPVGSLYG